MVRIIDLVSHTTYVVCVDFIRKWQDLQFKVDSEWQIFWETFHGSFFNLRSEFLPEICWKEIAEEILFVFRFDVWPGARTLAFSSNTLHYGDFRKRLCLCEIFTNVNKLLAVLLLPVYFFIFIAVFIVLFVVAQAIYNYVDINGVKILEKLILSWITFCVQLVLTDSVQGVIFLQNRVYLKV